MKNNHLLHRILLVALITSGISNFVPAYSQEETIITENYWWESFGDSTLNLLESAAIESNYNLRGAVKKIEASKQSVRQVMAQYYPTIGIATGYDFDHSSGAEVRPYATGQTESFFHLGLNLSWEIDLFGRISQKVKGAKADLKATKYEADAVALTLSADVATDYTMYKMYEAQLNIARKSLEAQKVDYKLAVDKYEAGLVSKYDVAQAKNMLNTTVLKVPTIESNVATMRNALKTLTGLGEVELQTILNRGKQLQPISPDLSSLNPEILVNRPDLASSRSQISSMASQVGLAQKDWLPTLSLNASGATASHNIRNLFQHNSYTYAITPTLSWTLFSGFSRSATIAEAKANLESQIEDYRMSLSQALEEVKNADENMNAAHKQLVLYDDVVISAKEMLEIATERYRLGLVGFGDISGAELGLLDYLTNREAAQANKVTAIINLWKALGGKY